MKGYCTLNSDASVDLKNKIGAYAVWIKTDFVTIKHAAKFKNPVGDSNMAEIMSVINGIHIILKKNLPVEVLVVNTDNKMCRDIVNNKRKTVPDSFKEVFDMLLDLCKRFPICYAKSIKGHTNIKTARHHVNRWCDEQAGKMRRSKNGKLWK